MQPQHEPEVVFVLGDFTFGEVRLVLNKTPQLGTHVFDGRKVCHPLATKRTIKKVPGKRDVEILHYDPDAPHGGFLDETIFEAFNDPETQFQIKWDGTSTQFRQDTEKNWKIWHSLDIHWDPKIGDFPCAPSNAIPCGPKPENAGPGYHWKHMMPCGENEDEKREGENKLQFRPTEARFLQSSWWLEHQHLYDGKFIGFETMGSFLSGKSDPVDTKTTKVNKKNQHEGVMVPFGSLSFQFPKDTEINYKVLQEFFRQMPNIEGLVVYTNLGIFKVRRELFLNEFGVSMSFGRKNPQEMDMREDVRAFLDLHQVPNFAQYIVQELGLVPKIDS